MIENSQPGVNRSNASRKVACWNAAVKSVCVSNRFPVAALIGSLARLNAGLAKGIDICGPMLGIDIFGPAAGLGTIVDHLKKITRKICPRGHENPDHIGACHRHNNV